MTTLLSIILFLIFSILSGLHIYWLFGGLWGLKNVIPSKGSEPISITIPRLATIIVALALLFFGLIYLNEAEIFTFHLKFWFAQYVMWFIPSIFLLRAIGEFNYVGIFKKIKHTTFAQTDNRVFIPLCLCLSFIGYIIQLIS